MVYSSFEVKNSFSFFEILKAQFDEYKKDDKSSRNAILTSILAYHLREWLWKEHQTNIDQAIGVKCERDFNRYINNSCVNFPVIREICNGSKHFNIIPDKVQSSGLEGGSFSSGFSSGFDIGELTINTGSNIIKAIDLLTEVVRFYEILLKQIGVIKKNKR